MKRSASTWLTGLLLLAGAATLIAQESSSKPQADDVSEIRGNARRLRLEAMRAPQGPLDDKTGLQNAIETVEKMQVTAHRPSGPSAVADEQPASAPAVEPPPAVTTRPAMLSADVLAKIVQTKANEIVDPAALADALYQSGQLAEACVLYRRALESVTDNDQRDWMLYQIGNCLRDTDPSAAREAYRKLLADSPKCPWAPLAESQDRLVEWKQANRPAQFTTEVQTSLTAAMQTPRAKTKP